MFLAKLAIRQPVFISMVLLAITLVGALSYTRMGVDLYPDMSNPMVSVSTSFPGASPQDVETLVTKRVEQVLSTVSGVDNISATSREGSSTVTVSFAVGYDIRLGAQEVRERLDTIKRRLPDGAEEPTLRRFDPNSNPFMTVALTPRQSGQTAPLSPGELRQMVEQIIVPRLERLAGVATASVSGLSTQEVGVDLLASKLKALRVSPQQVVTALRNENVILPAGQILGSKEDLPVRTSANLQSLDDVRRIVVARQGGADIQLQEVASVGLRLRESQSLVRLNGNRIMSISIQTLSGSNEVRTAHLVRNELNSISRDFPQLMFTVIRDDSTFIEESDRDVTLTLIVGAVLAALILLLFFRNIRNTLITVAGLPVIVIGTFSVISLLGFTRNIVSLMALSLSIGLLIDDAIVVRENIFRHMEAGASPRAAAEKATGEIAFAVLAITLTIVAVFIPIAFTTGQVGVLLKQFGITVAVAVGISLFEAFTFAPLLTAYFAKPLRSVNAETDADSRRGPGARLANAWAAVLTGYRGVLVWSLRYRWLVVGVATAAFVLSLWLARQMPYSFFPMTDPSAFNVGIQLPPGTPRDRTDQIARDVERLAMSRPEVRQVYAQVGQGGSGNQGSVSIQLKAGTPTEPAIRDFRTSLAQYGRTLSFSQPRQFLGVGGGMGGGGVRGRPVQMAVRGPTSLESLEAAADQVIERLRGVTGLRDVDKSLPPRAPELRILVDRQRAAQAGISATTVGQTIRTLVAGSTATQVEWQDRRLDVVVQLRDEDRSDALSLMDLPVAGPGGTLWPLRAVARMERSSGPAVLERQERQGQIMVGANLEGRSQGAVVPDIQRAMAGLSLPPGITWRFAGQQAQSQSAFGSLVFAQMLGLAFVYMVLASQFGSLIHPLTVMVALPLSAIGAVLALVAVRADLTVIAMIGIILLMGLATKNSILIVDFIIRYRREGQGRNEAVIAAGPVRLRPILMTTLAIVLGMAPTALGMGVAGAFRAPMAIAAIGGVVSSTLLSLVVVPVAYTLMDDAVAALSRVFRRQTVTEIHAAPAAAPVVQPTGNPGGVKKAPGKRWQPVAQVTLDPPLPGSDPTAGLEKQWGIHTPDTLSKESE